MLDYESFSRNYEEGRPNKAFEHWWFHEALPRILKSVPDATEEQLSQAKKDALEQIILLANEQGDKDVQ